ncbi:MAG: hypothetical protein PVJ55_01530 [Anaerolineae bacterium]
MGWRSPITDHDRLVPPDRLVYLNRKYAPIRIFGGIEVTTHGKHLLVLGVEDQRLEEGWWAYPDLYSFVLARGGFLSVAHPFRFNQGRIGVDLDRFPSDALEMYSRNTPTAQASRIAGVAAKIGASVLSDSDAHGAHDVGLHYIVLGEEAQDTAELVRMLKDGAFEPVAPQLGVLCHCVKALLPLHQGFGDRRGDGRRSFT